MAKLSLSLLGPFQAMVDGRPVTGFKSNKVRALLAYLAVEADRPHRREVLAGLLWPEWPDRDALSNLRYSLSNLRQAIGDRTSSGDRPGTDDPDAEQPCLLVTRSTLQFNKASDHWVDVLAFSELVAVDESDPSALERLKEAVALYRGGFLEGFSLGDSPAFEEWVLLTREQIARQASSALHQLAAACEQRGRYDKAQSYAWRQLELEPWDETAHRLLMRSLALSGRRSAALAQYETCRRTLAEELNVEPGPETVNLYKQIRDGLVRRGRNGERRTETVAAARAFPPTIPAADLPSFLNEDVAVEVESPIFVARERELARLDGFLDRTLAGRGGVAFVTGSAGSGKTALIQAFARRAQDAHTDLVVAMGNCSAYTGVGDPYLPFRQILQLLTGDVEAKWSAGVISRQHARRLWSTLPLTVQAMMEHGPDLIDTFVPRSPLLEHARLYERGAQFLAPTLLASPGVSASGRAPWLTHLAKLLEQHPGGIGMLSPQQLAIFEQYSRVLQALAPQVPLVLVLDDLQWADAGSIHLLFHLGRQLARSRVLIVGAYRPEEVALGRRGERHPLEPVVNEFQRAFGDTAVDLGQAERWRFVESLLDSEPNRLGPEFREMLYRQTRGHPLFTIELLRGLQERGDLVRDPEGQWAEGPTLDWETLPARVEAVIAERIGRLAEPLRAAMQVASVEGEVFTAEVVAQVRDIDERDVLRWMSAELDRGHRLIRAQSIQRMDGQLLSRYRFRHILLQKYLYSSLDEVERVHLHEQVGTALERLHRARGEQVDVIAVQLALHFQRAQATEKAIHYLHRAGDRAVQLSAYLEAVDHLTQALALLASLPDSGDDDHRLERAEQELALQLSLGLARMGDIPGPEFEHVVTRARELCHQIGKTSELCRVLGDMSIIHYVRAEHQRARELADEALRLAQKADDDLQTMLGHWYMGFTSFVIGDHLSARAHLERVISFYEPQRHHQAFVSLRGSDPGLGALAYDACCLWCLGYPEQAANRSKEALSLARELDHPFSLVDVVCFGGCLVDGMRQDAAVLKQHAEELTRLSKGWGFSSFWGSGTCHWGEALAQLGKVEEGIQKMREGLATFRSMGARCYASGTLGALAEAQAKTGRLEEGLATLAEALAMVEETNERYYEPELRRLRGRLLVAQGDEAGAEASFKEAIGVARRQRAKSWELRATVSVCRLWQDQGQAEEAHQRLSEIYGWFTEGFDTPDLIEARMLLDKLSRAEWN